MGRRKKVLEEVEGLTSVCDFSHKIVPKDIKGLNSPETIV